MPDFRPVEDFQTAGSLVKEARKINPPNKEAVELLLKAIFMYWSIIYHQAGYLVKIKSSRRIAKLFDQLADWTESPVLKKEILFQMIYIYQSTLVELLDSTRERYNEYLEPDSWMNSMKKEWRITDKLIRREKEGIEKIRKFLEALGRKNIDDIDAEISKEELSCDLKNLASGLLLRSAYLVEKSKLEKRAPFFLLMLAVNQFRTLSYATRRDQPIVDFRLLKEGETREKLAIDHYVETLRFLKTLSSAYTEDSSEKIVFDYVELDLAVHFYRRANSLSKDREELAGRIVRRYETIFSEIEKEREALSFPKEEGESLAQFSRQGLSAYRLFVFQSFVKLLQDFSIPNSDPLFHYLEKSSLFEKDPEDSEENYRFRLAKRQIEKAITLEGLNTAYLDLGEGSGIQIAYGNLCFQLVQLLKSHGEPRDWAIEGGFLRVREKECRDLLTFCVAGACMNCRPDCLQYALEVCRTKLKVWEEKKIEKEIAGAFFILRSLMYWTAKIPILVSYHEEGRELIDKIYEQLSAVSSAEAEKSDPKSLHPNILYQMGRYRLMSISRHSFFGEKRRPESIKLLEGILKEFPRTFYECLCRDLRILALPEETEGVMECFRRLSSVSAELESEDREEIARKLAYLTSLKEEGEKERASSKEKVEEESGEKSEDENHDQKGLVDLSPFKRSPLFSKAGSGH